MDRIILVVTFVLSLLLMAGSQVKLEMVCEEAKAKGYRLTQCETGSK